MIKAIIFDLDGTLCDTMEDLLTAMNGMLRHFGWRERSREELLRFINRGARNFVSDSMPEGSFETIYDETVDRAIEVYNGCYAECYCEKTAEYEGMTELLSELKKDFRLGVLSNKQEFFVKDIIDRLFPDIFDSVHGQVEEVPTKPDPEALMRNLADMGVCAEECVFVGDSDVDMKTGKNSGMYTVGVSWGYRSPEILLSAGADAICNTASDISDTVRRI